MSDVRGAVSAGVGEAIPARLRALFDAQWSYDEFVRLTPLGPESEGQAYAYSTTGQVAGDALSGSLELAQYPRVRTDDVLLPDMHGLVQTERGEKVVVRAAGFGLRVTDAPGQRRISHWMRFWTDAPELAWLNSTLAFGVGRFGADEIARFRYFAATPGEEDAEGAGDAPELELLGTARWEYPVYEAVRPFGDREGVGFATSVGTVGGGPLAGAWRGWHYPSYLRDGLYQIDAHVEIRTEAGVVLMRHGGLATKPPHLPEGMLYEVVQHAGFVTEIPGLAYLNQTLAIGVGVVHDPGIVTVSYYGLRV